LRRMVSLENCSTLIGISFRLFVVFFEANCTEKCHERYLIID
jgi:hypothetical protein